MRIRRIDRMLAASLLAAFAGSLALLAQPSAASTLASYDIKASVRYGCAQDKSEDSFVEVSLSAIEGAGLNPRALVLQVGLAGPESTDADGVFPEGGPSLVTLGENPVKVRLAGPVHDDDHVFLRQLDRPEVLTLPLQANCHRIKPTNFGLDEPQVQVAAPSCGSGSQANLKVTLQNPNDVDRRLQKIGIEQIDYTVLLVRNDGLLAGADPVGTLVSFDEPSASVLTLTQVVAKPANFQVRVIGLDGAVVSSRSIRLSCATGRPASSTPARPTPPPSTSAPASSPPNSSRPAPSTSAPTPTATVSRTPAPSSSTASRTPPASSPAGSARPPTTQPVQPPPGSSSAAVPPARGSSTPNARPSGSAVQPPQATPSGPASSASSRPAPSPEPSIIRLVEPRSDSRSLPVFQKEVALVVLAFAAAMAALVGMTVVNARRR